MVQTFERFIGLPEDLVARLVVLKAGGATIQEVVVTHVSAVYIIIHAA